MILTKRIRLRPSDPQRVALAKAAGAARWAWNWGLEKKIASYAATKKTIFATDLHKDLVRLKSLPVEAGGAPWLAEVTKCAPQEALRDLDAAYASGKRERGGGQRV